MPKRVWTDEEKAAFSAKVKGMWAEKKAAKEVAVSANQAIPLEGQEALIVPEKKKLGRPRKATLEQANGQESPKFEELILTLKTLDTEAMTYEQTGELLNTLNAVTTLVGIARRRKLEALDESTHRRPCTTCGRMIDISKPGGFQILTERDEHFHSVNRYYCSVNCVLAKNMPSHRNDKHSRA